MPLWIVYHPATAFTDKATKKAFSDKITKIYTDGGLPAFYVIVIFQVVDQDSCFVGGVSRPSPHVEANNPGPDSSQPFIRITIQHLARTMPTVALREIFLKRADAAMKPFIADMGYDWEYNVEETDRNLWKIQGIAPPMPGTEAEKEWVRLNRPVPFEKAKGGLAEVTPSKL